MGTFHDANLGAEQRSLPDAGKLQTVPREQLLLSQIEALQAEVSALRMEASGRAELEGMLTQLREANENLVVATVNAQGLRDDAEAANRRQNEFLAMLAHELRNPLAPIGMAASLLERIPSPAPQLLKLTQVVRRQVDHMAHLLDDLLDAARISSGKITLSLQPILLSEVIEQAVETVQPRLKERAQELTVDVPPQSIVANGDKVRLTQVFTNLLSNASKYTCDQGRLRLAVTLEGDDIVMAITDNGTGIAPDVLPHIFDLFTQGPRSLARSEGGLGVGLNVVRNLVAMHGGKVTAASRGIGQGSTFTVRLPVSASVPDEGPPQQAGLKPAACRVLLIEDNVDACDTLAHFLTLEGHEITTAYDGPAGLRAAASRAFQVVICDIGLPGLDGFDLIAGLRSLPGGDKPFAIALSGYCQAEDRARAIEAGFDHYLVKPVGADALLALIDSTQCQQRRR
jgi:signal transduction histidine kinase/CheY-like chemotaxis protein